LISDKNSLNHLKGTSLVMAKCNIPHITSYYCPVATRCLSCIIWHDLLIYVHSIHHWNPQPLIPSVIHSLLHSKIQQTTH